MDKWFWRSEDGKWVGRRGSLSASVARDEYEDGKWRWKLYQNGQLLRTGLASNVSYAKNAVRRTERLVFGEFVPIYRLGSYGIVMDQDDGDLR